MIYFLAPIVAGVIWGIIKALVPIDPTIRRVIEVILVLAVTIWVLRAFALI